MWDAVNLQHPVPLSPFPASPPPPSPPPPPHWEGSASQSRASIYVHSPLSGQPPGFRAFSLTTTKHCNKQGRGRQPLLSASPPRSCIRPPVLDHIICPPSPARCSLAAKLRFLSAPEDPGAPRRCGALAQLANQNRGRRTLGARRRRNHNKSTGVILQLR